MLLIRPATVNDAPLLMNFSRELAEYEREPNAVLVTEETLAKDGFGSQPKFRALIAEWDGQPIGYALFYDFYSSWRGSGIFLEDLFVREKYRGRGIWRALLSQVARIAKQEGCYALRWEVLDWNKPSIEFYKSIGARFPEEWKQVVLEAEALNRLANG